MVVAANLTGLRFGRLTVSSRSFEARPGKPKWNCICDCGGRAIVQADCLRRRQISSCGCLRRERGAQLLTAISFKHGMARSEEHRIWRAMHARCYNPKNRAYLYYGGRGIIICNRWLKSFENFYADMGPRPSHKHSIDRINNDGNYEPDNCRWATWHQQANNKRPRGSVLRAMESPLTPANYGGDDAQR